MRYEDLLKDLSNKKRTINDLIRFIKTRNDDNPNYSLLLGAGCSVTSDIRSANTLINEWEKEIIKNEKNIIDPTEEDIKDFFLDPSNNRWYDQRNKYSSLFEKRYDLPRQRRMFIEQEVRDKIPSIGYTYLIKQIEKNYFKTIFTTNFDDLINESFYLYSNQRPIVCAHDSAINSITVTSKRPKIIKLHGDYLFDDIKSTLRETESLEENIKDKFIEFAKDYGLIIIGYGGNDRSIIDVLTYLLKNEDYFKNGIYWCLREDSEINEDLRKLLWKDRVYYVKIDGFDELMAELNHSLNDGKLPIDSNLLNNQKISIIKDITENKYLKKSSSAIIQNDLKKMAQKLNKDIVDNFFKYLSSKEEDDDEKGFTKLSDNIDKNYPDAKNTIGDIQQLIFNDQPTDALKITNTELDKLSQKGKYYSILLSLKARCFKKLDKDDDALKLYQQLINIEPWEEKNYILASYLTEDFELKIKLLDSGIKVNKFNSNLYFEKARCKYTLYLEDNCFNDNKLNEILSILEKCTTLSPSLKNDAWGLIFKIYEKKIDNKTIKIQKYATLIDELSKQDPNFPDLVDKQLFIFKKKNEKKDAYAYIERIIKDSNNENYYKAYEIIYLRLIAYFNDSDFLKERFNYIESNYTVDRDYLEIKAELYFEKLKELDEAIKILESIPNKGNDSYKMLFSYYLYDKNFKKAKDILENQLNNKPKYKCNLLEAQKMYNESLLLLPKLNKGKINRTVQVQQTFLLLKLEKYQAAYDMAEKILKECNYSAPYILINYWIAKFKLTGKVNKERIREKIFGSIQYPKHIRAAANSLINEYDEAAKILDELIKEDYSIKYSIQNYLVFEKMLSKPKYSRFLLSS